MTASPIAKVAAKPNPSNFSVNERSREYTARVRVSGDIMLSIQADSLEDAKRQVAEIIEDDDFGTEIDGVDDVSVDWVSKSPPMYRVLRDGDVIQTTSLRPGDTPREPNDRGF